MQPPLTHLESLCPDPSAACSFTLPSLRWLGLRSCMLAATAPANGNPKQTMIDPSSSTGLQPLTRRDRSLAGNLLTSLAALGEEGWRAEVGGGCVRGTEVVWGNVGDSRAGGLELMLEGGGRAGRHHAGDQQGQSPISPHDPGGLFGR